MPRYKTLSQVPGRDTGEGYLPRRSQMTSINTAPMTPRRMLTTFKRWLSRLSLPRRGASIYCLCEALLYVLQVRILELGGVLQTKTSQAIKPNMS